MPPKSVPAGRITRTVPRKSVLQPVLSRCSSTSSQVSTAAPPPPATASSVSGLSLPDNSPNCKFKPKTETEPASGKLSSPATANPSPGPPQSKIKKIVAKSEKKTRAAGDQVGERAVTNLAPRAPVSSGSSSQDAILRRPKSPAAGDGGDATVSGTMVVAAAGLGVVKDKGRDEALAEAGQVIPEAGGSAKVGEPRTRKVVKKTVRIVKKIVKRKVPKIVVLDSKGNDETKGAITGLNLKEVDKLHSNSTPENVDSDGTAVNMDSNITIRNEEVESVPNVDIFKEGDESLELAMNALSPLEIGIIGHSGTASFEAEETSKIDGTASLAIENEDLKETQGQAEEFSKMDSSADRVVHCENVEELRDSTCGSSSPGFVADEKNEKLQVDNQLEVVDSKVSGMEVNDLRGGSTHEGRPDREEKNENGPLALGGEMEAMERRKRQRTEIFIGGLGKDTKEEDIKKRFEQIGEVKQVRLVKNKDSGNSKGFAFLQFASAADAKKALEKFSTIEICGKQCGLRPVEGNDTIFLGNINKKWTSQDVVQHLNIAKVQNVDKVIVMANPNNLEQNRGFAFLEFETTKDAQAAFSKLQKYELFVKQMKIKVAWAEPLVEPDEEEMLKVKSVYVEYLPLSWDEAKARNFFQRFGEIESIGLAKYMPSSRRKDFGFINYSTREAALACIEAFTREQVDDAGSKVTMKVCLARPKVKQSKPVFSTSGKEHVKETRVTSNSVMVREPVNNEKKTSQNLQGIRADSSSSTTDELLRLLRQQAREGQPQGPQPGNIQLFQAREGQPQPGASVLNYHYASIGRKRPFSALENNAIFSEPRPVPRTYPETSHLHGSTSFVSSRVGTVSLPDYQRQHTGYAPELPGRFEKKPPLKPREQPPAAYFARYGMYQRF